ncbi:uncharacterized protein [Rutidosis leptorrhynchoides]|uniref:uncharacterized protein n=1 Tax=Rutidosis leptorrhynchoides TaxID=125765 RepID=UPI003A998084
MKEKEVKEQIKADFEDILKELQASLEHENILTEKKVAITNLLDDIQIWTKKKETQIESERGQIEEMVAKLLAQFWPILVDYINMFWQVDNDLKPLSLKIEQARCLLNSMPKRHWAQMIAHYSLQLVLIVVRAKALAARMDSHREFIIVIVDFFYNDKVSTSEDVSSSKHHPLPSQTSSSSSSTNVPTPSTSSINPVP